MKNIAIEKKEGYTIVDKRTEEGKDYADSRDESLEIIDRTFEFAVFWDANTTTCKAPGKLIKRWKKDGSFKKLDKLNLKDNIHRSIEYIGK